MDDRLFDKLDRLQEGARGEMHPPRRVFDNGSTQYAAYDATDRPYDAVDSRSGFRQTIARDAYDLIDEPMAVDSFDEALLRQDEYNTRHNHAALRRARLPPAAGRAPLHHHDYSHERTTSHQPEYTNHTLDRSQYAFGAHTDLRSTSSPFHRPIPSSPTYGANQSRQLAAQERPDHSHDQGAPLPRPTPSSAYDQPVLRADRANARTTLHPQSKFGENTRANYAPTPRNLGVQRSSAPPRVQGISLVSTQALPDRLRSIFPYPLFNAVQSKSFNTIFTTNNNFVLSAPTGSGKTAVLELAICRLIHTFGNDPFKIVYQAPTKSLCAERQRDWQAKFGPLGLQCAELTGDTQNTHLSNVQQADIIITTPEKWDSVTRKWTDHQKLMQMVKLFLIDEVHILKEKRGATLEAVVSRMKSVRSNVRFVALSATVPNFEDIATWLGQDPMNPHLPASSERFGEEFRPVRLEKHVVGYHNSGSDFGFEASLTSKIPDVIKKWSQRKPIMVFCFTKRSCETTAEFLASWWSSQAPQERRWVKPRKAPIVGNIALRGLLSVGVAFHHGGLSKEDRAVVEKAYLEGETSVICCTSTLAVGVNLPCHMVIIKNTMGYQGEGAAQEYSDLEVMQMIGRAGRPQFDDSAVAIIMTRIQQVRHYENMDSGKETLESCLHLNLIDHLNAEIGLGMISGASSAKKWLSSTFLYVRLKENPEHYKIDDDASIQNLDKRLETICSKGIHLLEKNKLAISTPKLQCTEFGDAMARYSVQFESMQSILDLPKNAKVSEILSTISKAAEFKDLRFKAGEKPVYNELNKHSSIKFPIPVKLDSPAHKVSAIIQSVLGSIDLPTTDSKHVQEFRIAKAAIFQNANRLLRCIVDCQLYLNDAVTTRNALMLIRSIGAQAWDDSPLHMKQLTGIGLASVLKLANAGIKSIEGLENVEPDRIEQALSRHPPLGRDIQDQARTFPKLRISIKIMGEPLIKRGEHVTIRLKADFGFLNDKVPESFQNRAVYVCLLAERSDGLKIHFARIAASKLGSGQDVQFNAALVDATQTINVYIMCDELAGTMRHAHLDPKINTKAFPIRKPDADSNTSNTVAAPNTAKRRVSAGSKRKATADEFDEFVDPDLNDADFVLAEVANEFVDIEAFDDDEGSKRPKPKKRKMGTESTVDESWGPQQLSNGNWACGHKCSDKTSCKHLCCQQGLEKKPKPPKAKTATKDTKTRPLDHNQTQLKLPAKKSTAATQGKPSVEKISARKAEAPTKHTQTATGSREVRELDRLRNSIKTTTSKVPSLASTGLRQNGQTRLSFLGAENRADDQVSDSGVDNSNSNDLPDVEDLIRRKPVSRKDVPAVRPDIARNSLDEYGTPTDDVFESLLGGGHDAGVDAGADGDVDEYADGEVDFSSFVNDDWTRDDRGPVAKALPDTEVRTGREQPTTARPPVVENSSEKIGANTPVGRNVSAEIAAKEPPLATTTALDGVQAADHEHKAGGMTEEDDESVKWFKAEFGTEHFNILT